MFVHRTHSLLFTCPLTVVLYHHLLRSDSFRCFELQLFVINNSRDLLRDLHENTGNKKWKVEKKSTIFRIEVVEKQQILFWQKNIRRKNAKKINE